MQEIQTTLPVGTVIRGHYVIKDLLGTGSSSAVYLVEDQRIREAQSNRFALKEIVHRHKEERHRLVFEGALLRQYPHRALPRVYHILNDDKHDRVYLLMGYVEGPSLETLRQQQPEKHFSWLKVMSMMTPIVSAVAYLHHYQPSLIHRDIKPANIIVPLTYPGAVLVDFGSVQVYDSNSSVTAVRSFSSAYRAPEQRNGGNDLRIDIYGLGATFYTLLTGMVPADARSRLMQLDHGEIDPLEPVNEVISSIPLSIAETIQRAMAMDATERFSSVEQFWEGCWAAALKSASRGQSTAPQKPISDTGRLRSMPSDVSCVPAVALQEPVVEAAAPVLQEQQQVEYKPGGHLDEPTASLQEPPQIESEHTDNENDAELAVRASQLVSQVEAARTEGESNLNLAVIPFQEPPKAVRPRASVARKLTVLLPIAVLLIILGASAAFWYHTSGRPAVLPSTTPIHTSTVASTTSIPTPGSSPNPVSTVHPTIAGTYDGTIEDLSVNVSTTMSLTGVQQSQGTISGYLTLGAKLRGSGPFSGTIDAEQHFRFIVTDSAGHALLFFEGAMQSATSLSGDYYQCSQAQGDSCSRATGGGYGIWNAVMVAF